MACPDICTAAKCRELEDRIIALESLIEILENNLNLHLTQDVPTAHQINSSVNVSTTLSGNSLRTQVEVENIGVNSDEVTLNFCSVDDCDRIERKIDSHMILPVPIAHQIDTNLDVNVDINGNELRVQVELQDIAVNSDTAILPIPEIDDIDLSNYCTIDECQRLERKIDAHTVLPLTQAHENDSSVTVNLDLLGETLRVQVEVEGIGTNSDSASLNPLTNTIFITEEIREEVDCTELENLINNLINNLDGEFSALNSFLNNLTADINNLKLDLNDIENDTNSIRNVVEVDVIGTVELGECSTEGTDEDGQPITVDPHYRVSSTDGYAAKAFLGINQAIGLIDRKVTAIHKDLCGLGAEPKTTFDLTEYIPQLCEESLPKREDYNSESSWFEAMKAAISVYISSSAVRTAFDALSLPLTGSASFAITAGTTTILQELIGNTFKQEKIAYNDVCRKLEALENPDVVSLVATEKHLPYIKNKQLILHLVEPSDYPQRKSNSIWQLQIPAAKDEYDWESHFRYLIKCSGNQYAELQFRNYASVSGWFKNIEKANEFFDAILSLTYATQKNRVFPNHTNPNTNVSQRILRPYRAFITRINSNGKSECLAKYAPPADEDNSSYAPTCQ